MFKIVTNLKKVICGRRSLCNHRNSTGKSADPKNIFYRYRRNMDVPSGVFKGLSDRFNGVTVISTEECNGLKDFSQQLNNSLEYWIKNERRAIWFKVNVEQSDWIPHLTKKGFTFHHAKDGNVTLVRWLPQHENVNIPAYSHTMVGVGGAVLNDKNEVLVVSERYALIPNSWKLPGGYVEPGENLISAAIREVREETGIETEFETILSMRHSHGGSYDCSDMYIVVGLRPQTLELKKCEREIAKLAWMPVDEYLNHEDVHETNRQFIKTFLDYRKLGIKIDCEERTHRKLQKLYNLYYAKSIKES